jgi:hypothetical protein
MVPTVAAVATEEPEVAEKSVQVAMLVCSSPPGRRLNHTESAAYIRSAMPPRSSSSPSSMNSGIASMEGLFRLLQTTPPIMSTRGKPCIR